MDKGMIKYAVVIFLYETSPSKLPPAFPTPEHHVSYLRRGSYRSLEYARKQADKNHMLPHP